MSTKIEWVKNGDGTQGETWNPYFGCLNKCPYCYARRFAVRYYKGNFTPKFFPERLNKPFKFKKPTTFFVGSMAEIGYMDKDWIRQVIEVCVKCPQHTFLFLTKDPECYYLYSFPINCWLGTTIDYRLSHIGQQLNIGGLAECGRHNKIFLSYEPFNKAYHLYLLKYIDWVIIGAETLNGRLVKAHAPKRTWIEEIVNECRKQKIPVFLKNNLQEIWQDRLIQEIP